MTDFPDNTNTGGDILIVDDLPDNLKLLGNILKSGGHRFRPMTSGPMALRSIAEQPPELILLDIRMPEMDGFEVCRQLKADEHSRDIPVIFISAKGDVSDKVKAFEAGGVDYISKPFEAEEVLARVDTHLVLSRLRLQLEERVAEGTQDLRESFVSLKKSEEKYRNLFNTMAQGVVYHDESGKIISANNAAQEILGLSLDQLQGRTSLDPRWKTIYENGEDFPGEAHPAMEAFRTGKVVNKVVMGVYHPEEQRYRWIIVNAVPQILEGEDKPYQLYATFTDITERKQAEETLQQEKEFIETALNSQSDTFFVFDISTGKALRWNKAFRDASGYSDEEIGSMKALDSWYDDEDLQIAGKFLENIFEVGHGEVVLSLVTKDGKRIPTEYNASIIKDASGQPKQIISIGRDITDRIKAEERETSLGRILDGSLNEIYIFDADTLRFIQANRGAMENLGYSLEELRRLTSLDLKPEFTQTSFTKLLAPLRNGKKEKIRFNTVHRRKDGSLYPVEVHLQLSTFESTPAFMAIIVDITERKRAEEELRESKYNLIKAQEMAKIGNWKLTPETGEVEGSEELLKLFELGDNELTLDNFANIVHPEDREYSLEHLQNSIEHGTPSNIEHRLLLKDGSIKWVHVVGEPMLDNDGKTISVIGIVQDITARKHADEILRRSQKMDALGKLTGGVAHDYNNMLSIILGYSELLEEGLSEQPKLAKYAQEIHHAGERGSKLSKKLLAFSRNKPSDAEVLNINTLLQEEQHMLEKTLTVRIKLVLDLTEDLWPVWLDSGDLEDAIINMSINAMHAIEGQGQLTIHTRNTSVDAKEAKQLHIDEGDYVLLSIIDTGIGMDEVTKERMFEPFYSTKGEKGTGLGLSQLYGFMQRSAGAIKVYSELGHGTQLMLYFPRYHEKDSEDTMAATKDAAILSGTETILLVDDEAALLNLTSEILTQQGYRTLRAESGKQALKILENESVDLLLSDVIMPEMDGYQLVSIVQQKYPDIKIQLASGFSDKGHVEMVDDILNQNMLHKPYLSQTLLKRIRGLLDKK